MLVGRRGSASNVSSGRLLGGARRSLQVERTGCNSLRAGVRPCTVPARVSPAGTRASCSLARCRKRERRRSACHRSSPSPSLLVHGRSSAGPGDGESDSSEAIVIRRGVAWRGDAVDDDDDADAADAAEDGRRRSAEKRREAALATRSARATTATRLDANRSVCSPSSPRARFGPPVVSGKPSSEATDQSARRERRTVSACRRETDQGRGQDVPRLSDASGSAPAREAAPLLCAGWASPARDSGVELEAADRSAATRRAIAASKLATSIGRGFDAAAAAMEVEDKAGGRAAVSACGWGIDEERKAERRKGRRYGSACFLRQNGPS